MSLIGSTSFGFAQITIHDFQNTVLNSQWHCLRQMPQKSTFNITDPGHPWHQQESTFMFSTLLRLGLTN